MLASIFSGELNLSPSNSNLFRDRGSHEQPIVWHALDALKALREGRSKLNPDCTASEDMSSIQSLF